MKNAKPTLEDHNNCLRVCHFRGDSLSDADRTLLNIVAGAYACGESCTAEELNDARQIVQRENSCTFFSV